jgi:hypothetical protein
LPTQHDIGVSDLTSGLINFANQITLVRPTSRIYVELLQNGASCLRVGDLFHHRTSP